MPETIVGCSSVDSYLNSKSMVGLGPVSARTFWVGSSTCRISKRTKSFINFEIMLPLRITLQLIYIFKKIFVSHHLAREQAEILLRDLQHPKSKWCAPMRLSLIKVNS